MKKTTPVEGLKGEFSVIDGEFTLEPMGQAKLEITYKVPYSDTTTYRLKVWKQGGVEQLPVELDVNGSQEQKILEKDTEFTASFE
jgi:hypothetical protein